MAVKKKDSARLAKRLGKPIRRRKQLGWTQEMVAERVGVDAETISRIEARRALPSLPTLDRLAVALAVSGDLLSTKGPKEVSRSGDLWRMDFRTGADDRAFVMTVVRNCCEYLGNRSEIVNIPSGGARTAPKFA